MRFAFGQQGAPAAPITAPISPAFSISRECRPTPINIHALLCPRSAAAPFSLHTGVHTGTGHLSEGVRPRTMVPARPSRRDHAPTPVQDSGPVQDELQQRGFCRRRPNYDTLCAAHWRNPCIHERRRRGQILQALYVVSSFQHVACLSLRQSASCTRAQYSNGNIYLVPKHVLRYHQAPNLASFYTASYTYTYGIGDLSSIINMLCLQPANLKSRSSGVPVRFRPPAPIFNLALPDFPRSKPGRGFLPRRRTQRAF
jgi:hypothetical protein